MSRWLARGLLTLVAAGAVAVGLADPAAAAPPADPKAPDPATAALQQAVRRDLGISWVEYLERGAKAERAAELDRQLAGTPGYRGVVLQGNQIVVTGDGGRVAEAARAKGAKVTANGRRAASAQPMLQKYLAEVGADGLSAVQATADGWTITVDQPTRARTNPTGRPVSPQQFAEQNPGVEVRAGRPAERRAQILGGQGWVGDPGGVLCSVGFAGFDPSGRQEMLTAGHCSKDNAVDRAYLEADRGQFLGARTFSQFGGPNHASNTESTAGTDISIFGGAQQDFRPIVDTYGGRSKVTGVVAPVVGAPVCDSGRTSRSWRCSTISGVGPFAVYGFRGNDDVRWVNGFETRMTTLGGDSGGSMVSGLKAVGVLSAGGEYGGVEYSFGSDLTVYRQQLGHQVEIYLGTPAAPAAAPGSTVSGRVPVDNGDTIAPGTTVRVDGPNGPSNAGVGSDGGFGFTAPAHGEAVTLTVQNGFSSSGSFTWDPRYGSATGGRVCGLRDGGCYQDFITGSVYSSPNSGEHQVRGAIYTKWGSLGWETGRLGYPTGDEQCGLAGGGCFQQFQGGRIYFSQSTGAHPLWGDIGKEYQSVQAERSTLAYPTSDEVCGLRDGGCRQEFSGGTIGWSPRTGAHAVWGQIGWRWNGLGGQDGMLGWPTSGEMCGLTENGCWQTFSEGRMYWTPQLGPNPVKGAIGQKWDSTGYERGILGYPTGQEYCGLVGNGCLQRFQRGSIYWSANGAYWTRGAIRDSWGANGWETGKLGYPTSDEQCWIAGGCFQTFTGGSIYWSPSSGAWPVWGAIREYWAANGWEAGRFGYPTSAESCVNSGTPQASCRQSFQKGTITWSASRGASG